MSLTSASWFQEHEIPRKVLHGSIAPITISLYSHGYQTYDVTSKLVIAALCIGILEVLRFKWPFFNKMYIAVVGPLMRSTEMENKRINGVIWYLLGLSLVFGTCPKDICLLSVLMLSWGDLAASIVGRSLGSRMPRLAGSKSLAGSTGAFCIGLLCCQLVYRYLVPAYPLVNVNYTMCYQPEMSAIGLGPFSVLVGLITAIVELFPVFDDNFSIPVLGSMTVWAIAFIARL